ncbi:MAG: hypothetical protein IH849_06200 [Acidobacteria bacterium]|nr:hypothetical protein [Acidobacteriota bacterium]
MLTIDLSYYYHVAKTLQGITAAAVEGASLKAVAPMLQGVAQMLHGILSERRMPLGGSRQAGLNLFGVLSELASQSHEEDRVITAEEAEILRNAYFQFDTLYTADIRQADTYFVLQRGNFDTTSLIESGSSQVPFETRCNIPSAEPVNDFETLEFSI